MDWLWLATVLMPSLAFFWANCPCCDSDGECEHCTTGTQTEQVSVTVTGFTGTATGCSSTSCASYNGTYILTRLADDVCVYSLGTAGGGKAAGDGPWVWYKTVPSSPTFFSVWFWMCCENVNCDFTTAAAPDPNPLYWTASTGLLGPRDCESSFTMFSDVYNHNCTGGQALSVLPVTA